MSSSEWQKVKRPRRNPAERMEAAPLSTGNGTSQGKSDDKRSRTRPLTHHANGYASMIGGWVIVKVNPRKTAATWAEVLVQILASAWAVQRRALPRHRYRLGNLRATMRCTRGSDISVTEPAASAKSVRLTVFWTRCQ